MIKNYLKRHTYSELLDIISDVETNFNPLEMDYPTFYGVENINADSDVWRILDMAGLGSEYYVGGTPCIEGYYLFAITYRGIVMVYANHAGVNTWYCCIAQIGGEIRVMKLSDKEIRIQQVPLYVEDSWGGSIEALTDSDEISNYSKSITRIYPECVFKEPAEQLYQKLEKMSNMPNDRGEEAEALKNEILLDENDEVIQQEDKANTSTEPHSRNIRIKVCWEKPVDKDEPIEAFHEGLEIDTEKGIAVRRFEFHYIRNGRVVKVDSKVLQDQELLDNTVSKLEDILSQFMDGGTTIEEWDEH